MNKKNQMTLIFSDFSMNTHPYRIVAKNVSLKQLGIPSSNRAVKSCLFRITTLELAANKCKTDPDPQTHENKSISRAYKTIEIAFLDQTTNRHEQQDHNPLHVVFTIQY